MVIDYQTPKNFRDCKNLNPFSIGQENFVKLTNFLNKGTGNLILAGETGRRKTFFACANMNAIRDRHKLKQYEIGFCNVAELSQVFKANFLEAWKNIEISNRLIDFKVLIVDDLGVIDPNNSFLEFLYVILNKRCDNKDVATIFTTNLSAKEMSQTYSPRICSRISSGLIIKMEGPDYRPIFESQ
jgi:DNA replication protein DnaC